ncbi:MAG: hypothetical protein ACK6DP_12415 [Gemmatimonas sp.]|jgi:hypothetical protein|uniref:hypothetical protein n=1 Tax=Gemmatimonas sp. TaxID=1962908 RepID=UPI00391F2BCF
MSEHAFDPVPDEEAPSFLDTIPAPNATVAVDQVEAAIATGRWTHEVPGTELWLNTSFPPQGRDLDAFVKELESYGIAVE